jgi:hypothetical protein
LRIGLTSVAVVNLPLGVWSSACKPAGTTLMSKDAF